MADDDHIYCFLFIGTQMTRNMPRLGHWQRRLGRAFNVVIDPFLGEGVLEHADVILPALTYTERTGIIQRGDRTLQLQQPISTPPPLAWSDEQILVQLALSIARRLRAPWIVKHPQGYGSLGLTAASRVDDLAGLGEQLARTITAHGSALVEEFIAGREFMVLVAEPADPGEPPRTAAGVANRAAQLKAYGNAVVPAQAALAWRALSERAGLRGAA